MIYFDNAATTYPKPMSVINSATNAMKYHSFNSGRGGYKQSIKSAEMIYSVREKVGLMFGGLPENVVFTKNCTEALNIAIKGSVKAGEHIVISSLEHNSVSRVVESLISNDITYSIAKYSFDEKETVENFINAIQDNTSLVVCMHSSNVFGVTFPIKQIGEMCKSKGIRFIVDGAQGAGIADINIKRDNIDILCCAGHKCLMGIMGTGFLLLNDNICLDTIMQGGTGSESLSLYQPKYSPDRYEVGTLNNPGIISLGKGIDYINTIGMDNIYKHELNLAQRCYTELDKIDKVKLYTPYPEYRKTMPIISFNICDLSSEKVAGILAQNDICTRAGYHCSPLAHKHFNTIDTGTVRLSFGAFNSEKECNILMNVIKKL